MDKRTMVSGEIKMKDEWKLTDGPRLLQMIWPDPQVRPTLAWLLLQARCGSLPCVRIGKLVFFSVPQVMEHLAQPKTASKH